MKAPSSTQMDVSPTSASLSFAMIAVIAAAVVIADDDDAAVEVVVSTDCCEV